MKKRLKLFFKNLFLNTDVYYYDYIPVKKILGTYDDPSTKKDDNLKIQALIKKYKDENFNERFYIEVFPLIDSVYKLNNRFVWPSQNKLSISSINKNADIEMLPQYKYKALDGNHRLAAAKTFYGQDYEILAIVVPPQGWKFERQYIHKLCTILIYLNILYLILLLLI